MKHVKRITGIALMLALLAMVLGCDNPVTSFEESVPQGMVKIYEGIESPFALVLGTTKKLNAMVLPEDATNKNIIWTSSNPAIVSVDQSGLLTGNGVGTAYIKAKAGDITSAAFWVVVDYLGIVLSPTAQNLYTGDTYAINARVTPKGLTGGNWEWSSSDITVANVSSNGVVSALSAGSATITVTSTVDPDVAQTCAITVAADPGFVTIFYWDADADPGFADLGEIPAEQEQWHVTNPSTLGGSRNFNYGGKDWIFQNYIWTGTGPSTGFAPAAPGPMLCYHAGDVIETSFESFILERSGYFLNEALSPCLMIGSSVRGRTNGNTMPTGYNTGNNGQFDFSNGRFRITVNYTPISAGGQTTNLIFGVNYNTGSVPSSSNSCFYAAMGLLQYNDLIVNAGAERTYIGEFNTTNATTAQKNTLSRAFITVRAAVQAHQVIVHSIKVEQVQ